jgi:hypothetical protein
MTCLSLGRWLSAVSMGGAGIWLSWHGVLALNLAGGILVVGGGEVCVVVPRPVAIGCVDGRRWHVVVPRCEAVALDLGSGC